MLYRINTLLLAPSRLVIGMQWVPPVKYNSNYSCFSFALISKTRIKFSASRNYKNRSFTAETKKRSAKFFVYSKSELVGWNYTAIFIFYWCSKMEIIYCIFFSGRDIQYNWDSSRRIRLYLCVSLLQISKAWEKIPKRYCFKLKK